MKKVVKIMKDYVEGRLDIEQFWNLYLTMPEIKRELSNDKTIKFKTYYSPDIIENHFDLNNFFERNGLFDFVSSYFKRRHIDCNFSNSDKEVIDLIEKAQPKWLDVKDINFWQQIFNKIPNELNFKEKVIFLNKELLDMFTFLDKPPEWIQNPEWQFDEKGKPLKFIRQENDGESVKFIFFDEYTKKEILYRQFY